LGRFIIITFVFLGFVFYQMSGGSSFDPVETRNARIDGPAPVETAAIAVKENPQDQDPVEVTRVSLDLASVTDVVAPQRTLRTQPARAVARVEEEPVIEDEAPVQIILPSLIENAAPQGGQVTPVDFSSDAPAAPTAQRETRRVTGNRVNVRGGPGTDYSVVNRLVRGDEVIILEDPGNGWVRLRPASGGTVGWMAEFLLSEG
jgi:hypothetical protein